MSQIVEVWKIQQPDARYKSLMSQSALPINQDCHYAVKLDDWIDIPDAPQRIATALNIVAGANLTEKQCLTSMDFIKYRILEARRTHSKSTCIWADHNGQFRFSDNNKILDRIVTPKEIILRIDLGIHGPLKEFFDEDSEE